MKTSAGCLVRFVFEGDSLPSYLLVHPSGNYNRRAPWSIPKGELEEGEDPEACALRETKEETGLNCRVLASLGEARYKKSAKRIVALLAEPLAPIAERVLRPASWEVDRVEFLSEAEARLKIHPDQAVFLERASAHWPSAAPPGTTPGC